MRHQNTVFHDLIKLVPWDRFGQLVERHRADHRVRRFNSKSQFLALLYGQFSGAESLREIEAGLASQRTRLYHLGARPAARSTLADANAARPAALFEDLFAHMAAAAGRRARRRMGDALRILDATRIGLCGLCADWAAGARGVAAIKLHVVYDPAAEAPLRARTTGTLVNDITPAKALEIEPGATYVFDLGYYSFDWWARLDAHGCRFVTRLKTHTKLRDLRHRPAPEGGNILAERVGRLPSPHGDPMPGRVRELTVRIATGKTIRLVTNDLDAPAREIAGLYKDRWRIELFFKWIKQNLRIKRFLGTSGNAVRIQIFTALIAYLLLHLAHNTQNAITRPSTFTKLVRLNLMHRRNITSLKDPPTNTIVDERQTTSQLQYA